jgi:hypothetical protein
LVSDGRSGGENIIASIDGEKGQSGACDGKGKIVMSGTTQISERPPECGSTHYGERVTEPERLRLLAEKEAEVQRMLRCKQRGNNHGASGERVAHPIYCSTTGQVFPSQSAAAKALGIGESSISKAVRGIQPEAKPQRTSRTYRFERITAERAAELEAKL